MSPLSREELLRIAALLIQEAAGQRAVDLPPLPVTPPNEPASRPQYVTLDQAAAWVARSKRTLEKYEEHKKHPLPRPAIQGGDGRPSLWEWPVMRRWLQEVFQVPLPERLSTL